MAYYDVNKTDGTRVALVPDKQLFAVGGVSLLGKNYYSYGEIMAENMVRMTENFLNNSAPINPLQGQLWFDSTKNELKVLRSGTTDWVQLQYYLGTATITGFDYTPIKDTNNVLHNVIKVKVNNIVISIMSNETFTPHADTGLTVSFPTISPGINFNSSASSGDPIYKLRGRAIEAEFADMAEIYHSDVELLPGNIVRLGGTREITKTNVEFDTQVFGIVSTAPGFLLNSREKLKHLAYPVALKGRVPCIVKGRVQKGQRIVASDIAGIGMATDKFDPSSIVGRAISEKTTEEIGTIEVAVGVR